MAFHLESLRLFHRGSGLYLDTGNQDRTDIEEAKEEAKGRDQRFWFAERLLWIAAGALFAGLLSFLWALAKP